MGWYGSLALKDKTGLQTELEPLVYGVLYSSSLEVITPKAQRLLCFVISSCHVILCHTIYLVLGYQYCKCCASFQELRICKAWRLLMDRLCSKSSCTVCPSVGFALGKITIRCLLVWRNVFKEQGAASSGKSNRLLNSSHPYWRGDKYRTTGSGRALALSFGACEALWKELLASFFTSLEMCPSKFQISSRAATLSQRLLQATSIGTPCREKYSQLCQVTQRPY